MEAKGQLAPWTLNADAPPRNLHVHLIGDGDWLPSDARHVPPARLTFGGPASFDEEVLALSHQSPTTEPRSPDMAEHLATHRAFSGCALRHDPLRGGEDRDS